MVLDIIVENYDEFDEMDDETDSENVRYLGDKNYY